MMSSESVHITTRSQSYDHPPEKKSDNAPIGKNTTSIPPPTNGIHIEKHVLDKILRLPKSTIHRSILNPSANVSK